MVVSKDLAESLTGFARSAPYHNYVKQSSGDVYVKSQTKEVIVEEQEEEQAIL